MPVRDPHSADETPAPAERDLESIQDQTLLSPSAERELPEAVQSPDRYRIQREVARGGQSIVYVAFDSHLGREVAFKQPLIPQQAPPEVVRIATGRFLREARITATLEHPNIVPVYEIGRSPDGELYCTQKLILPPEGEKEPRTLRRSLSQATSLSQRLRLLVHVEGACQALAFAHSHGVIHRDVKPENVVIGAFGETVMLDWGLAKLLGNPEGGSSLPQLDQGGNTLGGYAMGTPSYMSPEQARGELAVVDERSDVWSLGALLYEVLTGAPPFRADTPIGTVQQVLDARLRPVSQLCPEAPPELAAVAEKALSKDPAQRYPSARALADELNAYTRGSPVGVYRYSIWELGRLFISRHRAISAVVTAALVLLAGAAAALWSSYRQSQRHLAEARGNLALTLIDKARNAERTLQWDRAAAYYAAARVQSDGPQARFGAQLASNPGADTARSELRGGAGHLRGCLLARRQAARLGRRRRRGVAAPALRPNRARERPRRDDRHCLLSGRPAVPPR